MKILIKNIGLMQDGKVTEHKNIAVEDKYIKEFPENPKKKSTMKSSKAMTCWPCRDL